MGRGKRGREPRPSRSARRRSLRVDERSTTSTIRRTVDVDSASKTKYERRKEMEFASHSRPRRGVDVLSMRHERAKSGEARAESLEFPSLEVGWRRIPNTASRFAKGEDALDLSRLLNDDLAGTVRKHPDRFVGLGTIPMQSPQMAVEELKRIRYDLRFPGVQIGSHVDRWNLDAPELHPIYKRSSIREWFYSRSASRRLVHRSSNPRMKVAEDSRGVGEAARSVGTAAFLRALQPCSRARWTSTQSSNARDGARGPAFEGSDEWRTVRVFRSLLRHGVGRRRRYERNHPRGSRDLVGNKQQEFGGARDGSTEHHGPLLQQSS
ncbi:unnamed protein product [Darwinula stevensoni]|uniref:2-amino-3-carboxymuconate-6-semialdehyde decarboxylase n=1 Tax=Darwinula stevensoni TaxID=69355 RepID=A0A7R9A4M2_9CRUS|nr:unnamed protein product [Darwinula stevensoni]CAG0893855.1 unnamed protein product [Darwinula stevensoni]